MASDCYACRLTEGAEPLPGDVCWASRVRWFKQAFAAVTAF
jgi:hypothetical protein